MKINHWNNQNVPYRSGIIAELLPNSQIFNNVIVSTICQHNKHHRISHYVIQG